MSIPAAESWDVVREAALAFRLWRNRHFGCRARKLHASTGWDVQGANFDASARSPSASGTLLSDSVQALGPEAPADVHLR